jgi:predicted AlkP superfamily pyrophosphatase or phosphodiesterase
MNSREMRDAVRMHDVWLRRFVSYLDRHVGAGNWALVLTGDHGATPSLEASGGFEISTPRVEDLLQERFDPDGDGVRVIEHASHTQMFVNLQEMREHGHSLTEISRAVMGLTKAATASATAAVPAKEAGEAVFEAAYPSSLLDDLPCLRRSGAGAAEIGDPG